MTVVYGEDHLVYSPRPELVQVRKTAAESGFDTVGSAFETLRDLRLLVSTSSPDAYHAYLSLVNTVRRDSFTGERVAVAAERYLARTGTWWELSAAFSEWANPLLVRMIDAACDVENPPLMPSDLL